MSSSDVFEWCNRVVNSALVKFPSHEQKNEGVNCLTGVKIKQRKHGLTAARDFISPHNALYAKNLEKTIQRVEELEKELKLLKEQKVNNDPSVQMCKNCHHCTQRHSVIPPLPLPPPPPPPPPPPLPSSLLKSMNQNLSFVKRTKKTERALSVQKGNGPLVTADALKTVKLKKAADRDIAFPKSGFSVSVNDLKRVGLRSARKSLNTGEDKENLSAIIAREVLSRKDSLRKTTVKRSPGGTPAMRKRRRESGQGLTPLMTRALKRKFEASGSYLSSSSSSCRSLSSFGTSSSDFSTSNIVAPAEISVATSASLEVTSPSDKISPVDEDCSSAKKSHVVENCSAEEYQGNVHPNKDDSIKSSEAVDGALSVQLRSDDVITNSCSSNKGTDDQEALFCEDKLKSPLIEQSRPVYIPMDSAISPIVSVEEHAECVTSKMDPSVCENIQSDHCGVTSAALVTLERLV